MSDSKEWKRDWRPLRDGMVLMTAIRDVMDNLGDVGDGPEFREYVRQNLLALVNVARQQTATEIYSQQAIDACEEKAHYTPHTIKETLREQAAAMRALFPTCPASSSSSGTTTGTDADMPF